MWPSTEMGGSSCTMHGGGGLKILKMLYDTINWPIYLEISEVFLTVSAGESHMLWRYLVPFTLQ